MLQTYDYDRIVGKLRDWVADLDKRQEADKPMYFEAGPNTEPVTPRRILREAEDRTDFGREFVESWHELAYEQAMEQILSSQTSDETDGPG